jgi:hypothetical protein
VATLVARAAPPEEVLAAVTGEAGRLLGRPPRVDEPVRPRRRDKGGRLVEQHRRCLSIGTRWSIGGRNLHTLVFQIGRAARIDDYTGASGPAAEAVRELGVRAGLTRRGRG